MLQSHTEAMRPLPEHSVQTQALCSQKMSSFLCLQSQE